LSYAIEIQNVTKRYDQFTAVNDLSMTVPREGIFGLLGPNGAGKTTTIRMIVGITAPDQGVVKVLGSQPSPTLQHRIGYLPEERGLYKKMKVGEQLEFLGGLKGVTARDLKVRIAHWSERLKMTEWLEKKTEELSKGMQQKIQFIATVLHEPDLIILDEPFSGLDPVNANLLIEVIQELKSAGSTIILSTHVMEQVERLCDEICVINRSRKVLAGNLRAIKKEFATNKVALGYDGDREFLTHNDLISTVTEKNGYVEIELAPTADPQMLLQQAIAQGGRISRFEVIEPSLNEIFIRRVSENE
jgi:ABC-2 type transport system ATP-binding protein